MENFVASLGAGLTSGTVLALIAGVLFLRRNKLIEEEVKAQFQKGVAVWESQRSWKQQALFELFGPLQMHFERTHRAFNRWTKQNLYLEAKVVKECNQTIRDLLLTKGHLIPPDLMDHACRLIEHYDAWLQRFDELRAGAEGPRPDAFVFVGPEGYPFPADAEVKFKETFRRLQQELFGV